MVLASVQEVFLLTRLDVSSCSKLTSVEFIFKLLRQGNTSFVQRNFVAMFHRLLFVQLSLLTDQIPNLSFHFFKMQYFQFVAEN